MRASGRRSILITGASGRVGRILTEAWAQRFDLTLVDLRRRRFTRHRVIQGNASDRSLMSQLCHGVDTVVHLASVPSPQVTMGELRRDNLHTLWTALRTARAAGCRRFVYASSMSIDIYPGTPYARIKELGERLAARHADGMSVVCLRLGRVLPRRDTSLWPGAYYLPYVLIDDDAADAFTRAIEAPLPRPFAIVPVISANRHPYVDIAATRALLGYSPRWDAATLADWRHRTIWGRLKRAKLWLSCRL